MPTMPQDRAQILITAVDQTKSAFDSIRGNLMHRAYRQIKNVFPTTLVLYDKLIEID